MKTLAVDIETYSDAELKSVGVYAYADAPTFEVILIAYSLDGAPVEVIDTVNTQAEDIEMLHSDFYEALFSEEYLKTAYNANFERTCLARYFKKACDPRQWSCTAVMASSLGLPGNLAGVGAALRLEEDAQKLKTGTALITYFCKPCKPTKTNGGRTRNLPFHDQARWLLFMEYNKRDVIAEMAIREKIEKHLYPESEQKIWILDQEINDRGICVDIDFVEGIVAFDEQNTAELLEEAKKITGLKNPNSLAQLKQWFFDEYEMNVSSITKDTFPGLIEELKAKKAVKGVRILEIRQQLGKTSTKKYVAMQNSVCSDGKIRGVLQFYGASRTGRWAGRIVQVHNLPQNKIPDIDLAREIVANRDFEAIELLFGATPFVFSQLIRTAFIASENRHFIISDFSAIEARVIAWLAGEQWRLDVFNSHGKIYEASASQMFNVPIEDIGKGSPLRQKGKVAELALGYQGSVGALMVMGALEMGLEEKELPLLVSSWRQANKNIVKYWYMVESAAKTAMEEHRTVKLPHGISFSFIDGILFIKLPSGRKLAYYNARLEDNSKGGTQITYEGVEQLSKRWGRLDTYGGKLVENIVQAVARDCLAEAMLRIDLCHYDIVMHVHDEIIVDAPIDNKSSEEVITALMSEPIDWAPGLPLKGDTYTTRHYKKD